jgi:hypothetical protein
MAIGDCSIFAGVPDAFRYAKQCTVQLRSDWSLSDLNSRSDAIEAIALSDIDNSAY